LTILSVITPIMRTVGNVNMQLTNMEEEDRKYYRLTSKGKEELEKRESGMKEIGEMAQENVLGFLCVYREIYGEDKFQELMDRMRKEF